MKKILLFVAIVFCSPVMAINGFVQKLNEDFKSGDFCTIRITVSEIRKATANEDYSVFSKIDLAYCNYYEAFVCKMLFDVVDNQEKKLTFNSEVLGETHYTTLAMKAIYNQLAPSALADVDTAIEAIVDEFGVDNWQSALMMYVKTEILSNVGKFQESYDWAKKSQESLTGTSLENHWINGCLYIMQSVMLLNLNRGNDIEKSFMTAANMWLEKSNQVAEDNSSLNPMTMAALVHLGYYVACVGRAVGQHEGSITISESLMEHIKALELDKTGLAMAIQSNLAIIYWKEKDYKKSRPMMQEYLEIEKSKGCQNTPSYKYIENLLRKTPKR